MTYLTTSTDTLRAAAENAAAAFSRSNELVDADVLDEVLAEIADKAAGTFRQFRDAMRAGREHELPYPIAALNHLLAVTAALRAALGYTDTPTAAEVVDAMRVEDVATAEYDDLRLHLFVQHQHWPALWLTDREVRHEHERGHTGPGPLLRHDPDVVTVPEEAVQMVVDEIDEDQGKGVYQRELDQIRLRLARANGTV